MMKKKTIFIENLERRMRLKVERAKKRLMNVWKEDRKLVVMREKQSQMIYFKFELYYFALLLK